MSQLFSPIRLRALELPNRIVVSPMCQYAADEGRMQDWHLMHLGQFAMGAAGLLFTEATHVSPEGRADFVMLARGMMYDPRWAWHAARELGAETAYPDQYVRCIPERWPQAFGRS